METEVQSPAAVEGGVRGGWADFENGFQSADVQ